MKERILHYQRMKKMSTIDKKQTLFFTRIEEDKIIRKRYQLSRMNDV